jgi:hypothetical protein
MTRLVMAMHNVTGEPMVEVFGDDGAFVASIYVTKDGSNAIHIVSQHFADPAISESVRMIPVPGYLVRFERRK